MWVSRIVLIAVAAIGAVIALDENSVIFTLVSFAWAGFGATFGPVILFSLFWKRMNRAGALAGMLTGRHFRVCLEAGAQAFRRTVRHL